MFSLLIYKNCIFWLRAAGSWKIPGLRSPWLWDCTASHSCWGRSCIFCLFYRILLHFELRGVTICTVPALPASVEILEPGTHGMCTTLSCPWNPRNSGTHGGSEVCKSTRQEGTQQTHSTYRTHTQSQPAAPGTDSPFNWLCPTHGAPWAEPQTFTTPSHTQPKHTQPAQAFALQEPAQGHGHSPAALCSFPKPVAQR